MYDSWDALRHIAVTKAAFLRREAIALGLDDKTLARARRRSELVRVRHGAYTFPDLWEVVDDVARHEIQTLAALRVLGERTAASHHSACALHGMDLWGVELDTVHLTRLDGGAGRTEGDVIHHEGLWLPEDVVDLRGWKATAPARAALESAHLSGVERGLVVADSGLRMGLFTPEDLERQHRLMQSWPGSQHLQLVTRLADGRSQSVGESRCRYLFWRYGLPAPVLQYHVYDGDRLIGITDFAWPEYGLLGEFDGKVKYGRLLKPGQTPGDVVFDEKRREDLLRRVTGCGMVRVIWADFGRPRQTATMVHGLLRHAA